MLKTKMEKLHFIVNIKPESFIHDTEAEHEKNSHEALYSKLFDYTLNLQSINIMDYDAILDSLIYQKEELIKSLLDIESVSLRDIPEMEWIIRGEEISIDYLATTNGFIDRNAAVACLDLIEENLVLLAADGPYNNIHDKLVDPKLKGRYTRMRNKVKK